MHMQTLLDKLVEARWLKASRRDDKPHGGFVFSQWWTPMGQEKMKNLEESMGELSLTEQEVTLLRTLRNMPRPPQSDSSPNNSWKGRG